MNLLRVFLLSVFCLSIGGSASAQTYVGDKPYTYMAGIYWNIVEDDGNPYDGIFGIADNWNMIALPTSLSFDYHLEGGWSLEALMNFNRYNPSNNLNRDINNQKFFFNFDVNGKYAFGQLMEQPYWDPFIFVGASYTLRPPEIWRHMLSPNIGVGFNVFIKENIAIQLRSAAKIGVAPEFFTHHSNYLHHHFGVVYVMDAMPWNQDFSKKKYNWLFKKPKWKGNNM
ncbi:MAG: hypothetical protein WED10_01875 [Brumimicrobium sp.]